MVRDRASMRSLRDASSPGRPVGDVGGHGEGFTLIEVVVALVIFALAFGILAQIIQTGFRQSTLADDTTTATLIARSQLARIGVDLPLQVGEREGDAGDDFRWRTAVQLVDVASPGGDAPPADDGPPLDEEADDGGDEGIALYEVAVTVAWGAAQDERSLTLTSLRLGPSEP